MIGNTNEVIRSVTGDRSYRVTYTEAIARDAVRSYVRRRFLFEQKGLWLVAFLMFLFFAYLLWAGDRSWLLGVVGAAVLLPVLFVVAGWRAHHASTVGKFRSMSGPVAEIAFREDGLAVASAIGSGLLPWSSLTEIWERPGYWMLFSGPSQFNTLPTEGIPAEDLQWLRSRVAQR